MYFLIFFVVVACMGVLLIPFISVYTIDMKDVQYVRPVIAALFTLLVFLQNVRIPGLTIICAAGHYKETRYQAGLEAAINIVVSLALVWSMGMTGVLIGTVCSYGYRSFEIILYTNRHLIRNCKDCLYQDHKEPDRYRGADFTGNMADSPEYDLVYPLVHIRGGIGDSQCCYDRRCKLCGGAAAV